MSALSQVIEFNDGAKGIPLGGPSHEAGNFMDRVGDIAKNPKVRRMVMTALKAFPATAPYAHVADAVMDGAQVVGELGNKAAPQLRKLFSVPAANIQEAVNAKGAKTPEDALKAAMEGAAEAAAPEMSPGKKPSPKPRPH